MSAGIRWCMIAVIVLTMVSAQTTKKRDIPSSDKLQLADDIIAKDRLSRQSDPSKPTPRPKGFFGTIFQLAYEQANDTKSALSQLNELFSGQFADGPQSSATKTPSASNSTSATEAPPKISRSEFLKILGRNLKGLRRLYNLEMREALRDSAKNIQDYRKEFNRKMYQQFAD